MSNKRRKGGRNWRPPRGGSGRRNKRQKGSTGDGGSATAIAEEATVVPTATSRADEVARARSNGRFIRGVFASRIWEAVRRFMGWDFCEEELEEESKSEDVRVPRILARMDQILDSQNEAWRAGELDRAELLQKAYGNLKGFLRGIENAVI